MVFTKIHFGIGTDTGIIRKLVMGASETTRLLPVEASWEQSRNGEPKGLSGKSSLLFMRSMKKQSGSVVCGHLSLNYSNRMVIKCVTLILCSS